MFLACLFSLVVSLVVFIYWFSSRFWEENLFHQVERRQVVLARAGAIGLENFFKDRAAEIASLAKNPAVQRLEETIGHEALLETVTHLGDKDDLIRDVARIDKTGRVVWAAQVGNILVETGSVIVADRPYFLWARDEAIEGQVMVSEPLEARGGPNAGRLVVILATPVFNNGDFNGILTFNIETKGLLEKYLEPLIPSIVKTEAVVITTQGEIVGGTVERGAGMHIRDGVGEDHYAEFAKKVLSGREGTWVHECHFFLQDNNETETRISSYSPTVMPGFRWVVLISTPYEVIEELVRPLRLIEMVGFTIGIIGILTAMIIGIFLYRVTERRAFLSGYRQAKKKMRS